MTSLETFSYFKEPVTFLPGNPEELHQSEFPGHNESSWANRTRNALPCALKCHLPLNHGGSQALMLSLLSLVTFDSKQETFGPTKLPRLTCETVMEEKAQEKSSLLENGTVQQGDVSCGSSGSAWQYS